MIDDYKELVDQLRRIPAAAAWEAANVIERLAALEADAERLEASLELWRLTAKEVTDELLGITADAERYKAALSDIADDAYSMWNPANWQKKSPTVNHLFDALKRIADAAEAALQGTDDVILVPSDDE